MAELLNKDPVTYERERDNFLKDLKHFHETRGTSFKKYPKISGKEVDLYLLYVLVTAHGGWIRVNSKNEWASLCEQFHLPSGCVNSGVGLKQIYLRYLDRYEKVNFLGEDGQQADEDDEDSRHRKWSARSLHSVPLTYNYHQHNIAESLREYNGLSADLYKPSNYDTLALSLLSPLPNEQDFAINVCTLLSNEGKHTLRLDKYPRLINILLAHAGVFDSPGTRQLFIEVYSRVRNYSINSFWADVLDSQDVIDLTDERLFIKKPQQDVKSFSRRRNVKDKQKNDEQNQIQSQAQSMDIDIDTCLPDCSRLDDIILDMDECRDQNQNSIKFEDEDKELFCVGRTLGTQDPYGQRVLQIASILRNLSFSAENAAVLGRNKCFLRFVLLCVRSRWSNLHQLGFDTLGNIANEIILKEAGGRVTDVILSCVSQGIESQDRFIVISCLEVMNKISQQDSNEEILSLGVDENVYTVICRFLALSDIALLVYTLECLYALTSLGERPCTNVARVRGAIDTLVALVTVEAQSYGPKSCILMKVVETVSTIVTSSQNSNSNVSATTSTPASSTNPTVSAGSPAPTTSTISITPVVASSTISTATNAVAISSISVTTPAASPSPVTSRPSTPASNSSSKSNAQKVAESANSLQQQHAHQQIIQENEQFALGWLRATFELAPGSRIEQEELYKKYLGCCTKIGRRGVIAPLHFPRCVRTVFGGTIGPNPLKGEATGQQYYEGIRVRAQVAPITYLGQTLNTNSTAIGINAATVKVLPVQQQQQQRISTPNPISSPDSTDAPGSMKTPSPASPILKAQLSAPPRPTSNNSPSPNAAFKAVVDPMSQVSVAHPHLSQALLASGSQIQQSTVMTNQQQTVTPQQQVVQVVVKDDSRGGVTSSSIIKSLLATKVTVSGDCMPGVAVTCVSSPTACVTNTTATSIASSISANQLITSNQVAQRQQQQRLLQQQLTGIIQPASPAATPALIPTKTPVNSKQKSTVTQTSGKKIQRVNGAKVIMSNNVDKTEQNDSESANQSSPSTPENHISSSNKSCQPVNIRPNQRSVCTPVAEDSDSTNNSLASSSGLGGSRDCSGVGAEEENSLTSFEGILLNGAPTHGALDIDAQDDGSSKDSSLGGSTVLIKDQKPLQNMMLADLLERKLDKEPIMNGVLAKNSINEKGLDIVENHIKKVLKEPPNDVKIKAEIDEGGTIKLKMEVTEDVPPEAACDTALIEAPRGLKRNTNDLTEEVDSKKTKYSNGTSTPEPIAVDSTSAMSESRASSVKSEEQDEDGEKATVSSTAAKLYADLAADCIEDELDEENNIQPKQEEVPVVVKEENAAITIVNSQIEQQLLQQQQQQQLIVAAAPRQIVVQQAIPNNQVIIPTSQVKTNVRTTPSQAQVGATSGLMGVLLQQSPGGQLQYVVSGGVPGQNYVLAQPQTALVQGQAQTVLVAQTTQQQGTATKTIIILQPQAAAPQNATQKMVAVTPQGQQVVVTQMPRPMMQSSALGNIPPPLVPTSASIPHSIIVNSSVAQTNPNTVTVTIPAIAQATPLTSSMPSRVLTPSPSSTPPPRPAAPKTPQGTSSITPPPALNPTPAKTVATKNTTSTTTSEEADNKPSTSQQTVTETKTITIKIDPNAFLCEWRGCLKQFKTAHEVYLHVCEAHCPTGNEEILCLWSSCDGLKRRRFSLMTHLYDRHCNADTMSSRRKQLTATGKTEVSTTIPATPHHPGYAPNAAFHAIKRHALEFVNPKELMQRPSKPAVATSSSSSPRPGQNSSPEQDDNEGPVTKSIRLTAALILRNLVIYSAYGRRHLRAYEPHLASVALSNVESSRTIAQVLYDMNDQSNSGPR